MNVDPRCFGKEPHPTQASAERQLKAQLSRRKGMGRKRKASIKWTGTGLMTYRCAVCAKWHIGHGS